MHSKSTWTEMPNYLGHEINTRGEVRNIKNRTALKTSTNQHGLRYVSIRNTTLGKYENKPIAVLVAEIFCPKVGRYEDTVLHRDGDSNNVNADNLSWASRWHAIAYHKEIVDPRWWESRRIVDELHNRYGSIGEAARRTTCLPSAIEYAVRYNSTLSGAEHTNFVQRCEPGQRIFRG